ncbi:MAG: DNA primase [Bacteroidetes bacterium CG18_big_fil_WC_8_21_14_2_50_41_14]|nr:MAG: DNA primase [Bacteroidetes bacterium CG18_big_fil_WC_8_21_14_2_50_41_14]PJB56067.1 MAG: DNA primase [Bacteroidetes bacterium CG_4_9_14_3_um_filter_41_19]
MIDQTTIQSILETAHVEEVIGDFVSLKKRGANYLGLCPFHNEKTPSFSVSPARGIYKCFGCGKAGNVVNFVMEHEHYSYPEALKYLAKRYSIDIEEEEMTPEKQQELDERESLFAANTFINQYFIRNLFESEEGKAIGLSYFKQRDFRESTIREFGLGYAHESWDDYTREALKNGFKKEVLIKTGLTIEKDGKLFDRFRGRVMFPIHNLTGTVIGFGARILSSDKSKAKYLNSPESEIYFKSKVLYGIYFARTAIVKQNSCYLVEGYTDVISLYQAGIHNVVSSSGTSLTIDQIKLIKRYTPNITILYDGDPAGIKASFRGIDLILEQGLNVKVVLFPEGEDPDSYAKSHRTSETEEFITKTAVDFLTFKTNLLLNETTGDPAGRAALIKEIVQSISLIPDPINRTVYIQECSVVMGMPEQTLMNELNKLVRNRFGKKNDIEPENLIHEEPKQLLESQLEADPLSIRFQENEIMRWVLTYGNHLITFKDEENGIEETISVAAYFVSDLEEDQLKFENPIYNKIFDEYKKATLNGQTVSETFFANHPDKEIAQTTILLITSPYHLSENWEKNQIFVKLESDELKQNAIEILMAFKLRLIGKQLKEIAKKMQHVTDEAEIFVLQQQHFELKKLEILIAKELNRPMNY